ncbi:MAG: tRNA uridine-5-carboxymethylaminomethyl(34) synthesis enzyme MnmG, partial [Gemmatimonadetes bacterium]|nr:tRNA uridine-5-carboxymethylaminomethyl(34) synthesis enzyme MnmG [Gemmatimonadota bacterium]
WFVNETIQPADAAPVLEAAGTAHIREPVRIVELLKRPTVSAVELVAAAPEAPRFDPDVLATVEVDVKYAGYVKRETERAERLRSYADFGIPEDAPYETFTTLSVEARQKLIRVRPTSLAQAGRIPGVSPADLQNLMMEVRRRA